jgi:cell division protein FtsB
MGTTSTATKQAAKPTPRGHGAVAPAATKRAPAHVRVTTKKAKTTAARKPSATASVATTSAKHAAKPVAKATSATAKTAAKTASKSTKASSTKAKPTPRAKGSGAPELLSTARSDISQASVITVEPTDGTIRVVAPAVPSKVPTPSSDETAKLPPLKAKSKETSTDGAKPARGIFKKAGKADAKTASKSSDDGKAGKADAKADAKAIKKKAKARRMAAKMREAGKAGTLSIGTAIRSIPTRLANLSAEQRRRIAIVAAVVVIVMVSLYAPMRDYYTAVRDEQVLSEQLDQVSSENADLQDSISALQTREGIEDEARRRGYVESGETAVSVEGLSDTSEEDAVALTGETDVADDEPWYIRLGDLFFGYDPSQA